MKRKICNKIPLALSVVITTFAILGLAGCPQEPEHEHTFSEKWTNDENDHWKEALCDDTDEVIDKASHNFSEWSDGKRLCYVCDYEQTCEHTWDEGVVTTKATLAAEGLKTYTCIECHKSKTESIEKLPYNWFESPVDAVTGVAATASSTYVYFGVFPQSVLPEDSTVTVDENDKVEMGANTYYKGSDGEYYAKVLENAYGTGEEYKYTDGTQIRQKEDSSYRYFRVDPIKWKVLTADYDGKQNALLLAEDILTANVPYYKYSSSSNPRTVGTDTNIYPNNYKYSHIRAYLNGLDYYYGESSTSTVKITDYTGNGFLQTAFTVTAQTKIMTTSVDNSAESTTDAENKHNQATSYKCDDTQDKVFLLSEKEVTTTTYGFAENSISGLGNSRIRFPTDYAMANYSFQSPNEGYGGGWWLRSPFFGSSIGACIVYCDGKNNVVSLVNETKTGVVPALTISLQ